MRQVELQTEDGEFVAVVEIPSFSDKGMPDIILWETRVFQHATKSSANASISPEGRWIYLECSIAFSFTPSPGLPK